MIDVIEAAARRIGLLADTHDDLVEWPPIQARLAELLSGVELLLHCGDLCTLRLLDRLAEIAPVLAVRSPADPAAAPPRLVDGPRVVRAGGLTIGVVNALGAPPVEAEVGHTLRFPGLAAARVGVEVFGRAVDVVVFGGSHVPCVASAAGILFVNPGSPSLAEERSVGILDVGDGVAAAQILAV